MKTRFPTLLVLLLCFWAVVFVLYYPARDGRFVFDYLDLVAMYKPNFGEGLMVNFKDIAFRPFTHVFLYPLVKWIGNKPTLHLVLATFFHAATAIMLYKNIELVFEAASAILPAKLIALFAALLFLLSPFQTECVLWGGASFYANATLMFMLAMYFFLSHHESNKKQKLILFYLFSIIAFYTHEVFILLPFFFLLLKVFLSKSSQQNWAACFDKTTLPIFGLIPLYFIGNKLVLHRWIGHYGADAHTAIHPVAILSVIQKYFLKQLFFAPFLPDFFSNKLYQIIELPVVSISFSALVICVISWCFYMVFKNKKWPLWTFFFLATLLFLIPVANLYFPTYILIHGDRLGYFASLFIWLPLLILFVRLLKKWAVAPMIIGVLVSLFFLTKQIQSWHTAAMLQSSLENSFKPFENKKLYILNLPDSYRGAYMYRCKAEGKFAARYKFIKGIDVSKKITEVLSYNLNNPLDSVIVQTINDSTLQVTLSEWGTWYWRNTMGAVNYESDKLSVAVDEWNHSYTVVFKDKKEDNVFLYQANGEWRVYDF